MAGENCTIMAVGHGSRKVRVVTIDHGINIVNATETFARKYQTFAANQVTSSSFGMSLVFVTQKERQGFTDWLVNYAERVGSGAGVPLPLTIIVPSQDFMRSGYPVGGIEFGDDVQSVAYRLNLSISGARGAITGNNPALSHFEQTNDEKARINNPIGATQVTQEQAAAEENFWQNVAPSTPALDDPQVWNETLGELGLDPASPEFNTAEAIFP